MQNFQLSEEERKLISRVATRGKLNLAATTDIVSVTYVTQGNFTFAVITTKKEVFVGAAKRSPKDPINSQVGQNIAFTRAIST